jgi:hypothetical protein
MILIIKIIILLNSFFKLRIILKTTKKTVILMVRIGHNDKENTETTTIIC